MPLDFNIKLGADAQKAKKIVDGLANEVDVLVNKQNVVSINADTSKAKKQVSDLDNSVKAIQDKKIRLELDADATQKDINKIETQLDLLTKEKKKISVDVAGAESDIAKFKEKINNILENEAKLKVNSSDAKIEIDKIQAKINEIQDKKATLEIDANNSNKIIDELQSNLKQLEDKKINIIADLQADNFEEVVSQVEELDGKNVAVNIDVNTEGFADIGAKFEAVGNVGDVFSSVAEKGNELNQSLKEVQAQTGLTGAEFDSLKTRAEGAFVQGVGESLSETTKALGNAQNILGKFLSPDEINDFVVSAGGIAKVFDKDINEVIGGSRTLIANYGLAGKEAGDLVAYAMQQSGSKMDDTLDTLDEYSQLTKTAGFNAQEFVGILTTGMQAGARDTDKLADAIKETQIRLNAGDITKSLKDINTPITKTIQGIVALGESGQLSVKEVMQKTSETIKTSFDAGTISAGMRDQLNVAISGTMAEDIGGELYNKIFSTKIDPNVITKNAQTAGEAMANAISPTTVFAKFEKQAEVVWSKVSSAIAPIASNVGGALTSIAQVAPALKLMQDYKPGDFSKSIKGIKDFANQILFGIVPAVQAEAVATGEATVAQEGLNTAQKANPMGIIVVAIVAVVGAMYLLYQNVESVRKVFDSAFAFIKDVIGGIITALSPLMDAFKAIGNFILTWFLAPFKVIYGVIEGVVKSFSGATEKTQTWGQSIATLKPIFEKISGVISVIYNAFSKFVNFVVNSIVAFLVPKVQWLIAIFGELSSFLYDKVVKAFQYVGEKIKPIVDAIAYVATKAGEVINSVIGDSAEDANNKQKELYKSVQASVSALIKEKNSTFDLSKLTQQDVDNKKKALATTKEQALANAKLLTNEKEKAEKIWQINALYNEGIANLDKFNKASVKTVIPVAKTAEEIKKAEESAKKLALARLETEKINQLADADLIIQERKRNEEKLKINYEYSIKKANIEKSTDAEIDIINAQHNADVSALNRTENAKKLAEDIKALENSKKSYANSLNIELEILKDFIDKSIATEQDLEDFRLKSIEKRAIEQKNQLLEIIKADSIFIDKQKELEAKTATGELDTTSYIAQLNAFADERLKILSENNDEILALNKRFALINAKAEKDELQVTENAKETIRISNITNRAERERAIAINEAKKINDNDLLLAKNNSDLKLQANLKYLQAVKDANDRFNESQENTFIKLSKTMIASVANSFANVKAIIKQTVALSDPKQLKEFSEKESELQKLREDGSISYEEYANRYKQLEKEKADATANATKTSIDWMKTLATVMSDTFKQLADSLRLTNANLTNGMMNNLGLMDSAKSKFGENSAEVTALTDANQSKMNEAYLNTGAIASSVFLQMVADGASASKAFVMTALASVKALIPILAVQIYGKQIADAGPVGILIASGLVALLTGLISVAESGLSEMNFAEGGLNKFGGFGAGLHKNEKAVISRVGETGRAEYVLNPDTTAKSLPELEEINRRKISVKEYIGEKMNNGLDRIEKRLVSLENTISNKVLFESKQAFDVKLTNNILQSVTTASIGRF